jgi:uncharacterized protein YbjT (DUF2867 family)
VIVHEAKLVRTPQGFGRRYVRSLARTTSSNTGPPTLRVDRAGHRSRARLLVGDLTDVASLRAAMSPVRTLFLLNAVTPDEVTQALVALNLAREAGIERVVYLSVIHSDKFTNVPHFTGKHAVERMIESLDIPATILRPAYFMQNERLVQQVIQGYGLYPMPIGSTGVAMIDARDIADIAVAELPRSVAKSLTAETTWRPSKADGLAGAVLACLRHAPDDGGDSEVRHARCGRRSGSAAGHARPSSAQVRGLRQGCYCRIVGFE